MILADLPAGAGLLVAVALGLVFGSFANVCIHRLPEGRSVVWPGSACPACGAAIRWHDNVPVLSWLLLRGRCRACRVPIPPRYPLVEGASASLLAGLWLQHGLGLRWAALAWLAISILILVPIDWRHGILPDAVTLPGLTVGLALSIGTADPGPAGSLLGAAVGGGVPLGVRGLYMIYARAREALSRPAPAAEPDLAVIPSATPAEPRLEADDPGPEYEEERREGMGLGDVKMLAMIGAFVGMPRVLLTMLLGSVLGSLYVVPLVLAGRRGMKAPIPFGPFLGLAAIVAIFWGTRLIDWYTGLILTFPFGG